MDVAYRVFPSIERLLVVLLEPIAGCPITAELPHNFQEPAGNAFELPVVAIDRIAGEDLDFKLDRPIIDVDVYAADRTTAQNISEDLRAYIRNELPGSHVAFDGYNVVFGRCRTIVGPRCLPHSNPTIRRYSANYELLLHPQP